MIKLFNKIRSLAKKIDDELLYINLATNYQTKISEDIDKSILSDVKEQSHRYIKNNPKFKKKLDDKKIVTVRFYQMDHRFAHIFYWNGESLFSITMETTSMSRDMKINNLLNG